jgi:hypothetical protein
MKIAVAHKILGSTFARSLLPTAARTYSVPPMGVKRCPLSKEKLLKKLALFSLPFEHPQSRAHVTLKSVMRYYFRLLVDC